MTLPPRWSEIADDDGFNPRFAVNDTSNDELYMGENIGPIVTGDVESSTEGVLASRNVVYGPPSNCWNCGIDHDEYQPTHNLDGWIMGHQVCPSCGSVGEETRIGIDNRRVPSQAFSSNYFSTTADVLPGPQPVMGDVNEDNTGQQNVDMPETSGIATSPASPVSTLGNPSMASAWRASDYIKTIQKEASDSDIYFHGYQDAINGKEMDEGMANLSIDYFQGYKQGLLYNKHALESSPPESIQNIFDQTHYEMQKSAPNNPK